MPPDWDPFGFLMGRRNASLPITPSTNTYRTPVEMSVAIDSKEQMYEITTYRTALPEALSLLQESQKIADKKLKDEKEKIARKAVKNLNGFLRSAIKAIKKAAHQGYHSLDYEGKFFNLSKSWNDVSAKLLSEKLIDLGFKVQFAESHRSHTYDGTKFHRSRLTIQWTKD